MPNHAITLKALLSLKNRRESRIRILLSKLDQQLNEQMKIMEDLQAQRMTLCEHWKVDSSQERLLTPSAMREYRIKLRNYYQQDQGLLEKTNITKQTCSQLKIKKEHQLDLLKKVILEQEKLKFLME